ncbi:MAG: EamA family transporter [Proteobacteria bacterium]|nr:EamA family transporter [Pseudomonadota bacterium]
MSDRSKGVLQMLLSGVCFGFLGVFGKWAYERGVQPGELLAVRFLVAAPLLGLGLLLIRPKALRLGWVRGLVAVLLGVMGYAVFASFYFEALSGLSASLTVMLLYAYPILVTLGARIFFNERVSTRGWVALPLVSLGLVLLVWGEVRMTRPGYLAYGVLSAVFYAAYILASRR